MAHILSQNWLLSRRQVLRGAGVAMALPLLDCRRPLLAADNAEAKPRRNVFLYIPNGVNTLDDQITQAGAEYEFSKCLKPLETVSVAMSRRIRSTIFWESTTTSGFLGHSMKIRGGMVSNVLARSCRVRVA